MDTFVICKITEIHQSSLPHKAFFSQKCSPCSHERRYQGRNIPCLTINLAKNRLKTPPAKTNVILNPKTCWFVDICRCQFPPSKGKQKFQVPVRLSVWVKELMDASFETQKSFCHSSSSIVTLPWEWKGWEWRYWWIHFSNKHRFQKSSCFLGRSYVK